MFLKKMHREEPSINGSSMADIAFLLLIFFLVTTTINVDTGITLILPPLNEEDSPLINKRNQMNILVNSKGEILMDGSLVDLSEIKYNLEEFILNYGQNPELSDSPGKAIVSILTQSETPYRIYIDMLDEVIGTYNQIRNIESLKTFGLTYSALNEDQKKIIKNRIPKRISIAEPDYSG